MFEIDMIMKEYTNEMMEWLVEYVSIGPYYWDWNWKSRKRTMDDVITFTFSHQEDFIAFKLRWL